MITKNILKYLAACLLGCGMVTAISSCSEDDPFFSAGENDAPRILNTDIPEGEGGEPGVIMDIQRTQNFEFEVIVTPARYTTVTWFIDDEQVAEGLKINVPVLAGDHILKIVATTTKGLTASRTCKLIVRPLDGDPALANDAKSRWLTVGTTKTIDCTNVTSVSKVLIGKTEATNVSYADGKLRFDVPEMAEGDYQLTLVDGSGSRYGCNVFTVSNGEYVEPGVKEIVLWEGDTEINWGESNVNISPEILAEAPVGATILVYYEMVDMPEGYHAMRITTPSWGDNPEDQVVAQFDLTGDTPNPYEFTYTDANKTIVDARGGMLIVGYGYKLTKMVAKVGAGPVEKTLWEGGTEINWGESNVNITPDIMAEAPVGSTICVYYEMVDMPEGYHAMRITTPSWGDNPEDQVVAQFDLTGDTPNPYEFTYTDANKAIVDARGGMLIVGYGYKVTKVVAKVGAAPTETTVWEGDIEINWGDSNVNITPDIMAAASVGSTVCVYYEMADMPEGYHAMRITTPSWGDNPEDQVVAQFDLNGDIPNPYEFTYTEANKAIVDERGGMLIVGYGYKLKKITVK